MLKRKCTVVHGLVLFLLPSQVFSYPHPIRLLAIERCRNWELHLHQFNYWVDYIQYRYMKWKCKAHATLFYVLFNTIVPNLTANMYDPFLSRRGRDLCGLWTVARDDSLTPAYSVCVCVREIDLHRI